MTEMMKAAVKKTPEYGDMELLDVEVPTPKEDEVKVATAYTGICGSDVHTFKGEYSNPVTPVTLGHEFSGVVAEVGPDVTEFKPGDRIVSETTFRTCGICEFCKEGDFNLCSQRKGIGTQVNGSMAKYFLARQPHMHKVPDNVSLKAAAFMEPLACCVHAVMEKTTVKEGEVVLVIGPGPMGLLTSQVVKAQGKNITVILSGIDKDKERLDFAKNELGVDYAISSQSESLEDLVHELTDKDNQFGVDHVFDCSGSHVAVNQALKLTKKKGKFIQVGLFPKHEVPIDTFTIYNREIEYIGSRSQNSHSWPKALKLLEEGKVNTEILVTKVVELEDWKDAFDATMAGNDIKVMIKSNDFDGE
ncbi:zinc-binding dehydrogenase [Aerococcus urinae]|uniref:Zinc-binding dehydrogenase n=2 Tax=Aerococcus urinae TaxID=1376 RepID=A0ABT4C382_9LACT|nr:zinc-binding dehydrogenase [Aerococcus urinae]MCY3032198.1 zinc-binding dehydrogenase [Aerococcus urinae]MCY3037704.1 zinc-binding dehydrogenase [Aerococcus urinae]MCY3044244.1 zinc-binding dehydrogenase [Aerococcus urinae]MCY3045631.1 zinc-binding dehydrogenase [Aerococcus urinae]MCY3047699.1 zinc-binding dehydrogenase [Aerococcus urinae]